MWVVSVNRSFRNTHYNHSFLSFTGYSLAGNINFYISCIFSGLRFLSKLDQSVKFWWSLALVHVWILHKTTRLQREINIVNFFLTFIVIAGNYAILSTIVAVNKKKDSFKVSKFHLATTEKMGKINFTSLVYHTGKGLSNQRTAAQDTSNAISVTSLP